MLKSLIGSWKFDVRSAALTVVVIPLLVYVLAILRRYTKAWAAYAVEGGMYWLSRFLKRSLAGALTLKRYCRLRLAEDSRYLFVPSRLDVKLEIDRAFIPLSLDNPGGGDGIVDHRSLLSVGSRLRVVGDPGSGKSSLVKRLFRDECYRALKSPSKARLPVLIELKNLSVPERQTDEQLGDWFVKRLRDAAKKSKVYQMEECFSTYAEDSGLLVFLDGLDEVSTSSYPRVQRAILALSARLHQMSDNSSVILTMRTQFHQQVREAFRDTFGPALFLKPFSPSDIYEFLTRWPFRDHRDQCVARIYADLTDRPTLREMCSNPLVLAMYVAEDQAAGHVAAPESRTQFYERVSEELLIRRRLQQTGTVPAQTSLREQRERILGRLAYEHILNADEPTNSLRWEAAIAITQDVMKCDKEHGETLFREIAKETGLISEERPQQSLRFIHLTFCEFLAAHEAVQGQSDGWTTLISTHQSLLTKRGHAQLRSRLLEVIPFASGLLPRIARGAAIADVAALSDDALLARCFLETKHYEHREWPLFAQRQRAALLATPEAVWDDRWLRDLHLFNVVIRDAAQCSRHLAALDANVDLDQFFQTLVGNQKDSLGKLLSAYAVQDAAAVFRLAEVSHFDLAAEFPHIVISNCDQPPFLALAVEKTVTEPILSGRWILALAEAGLRSRAVGRALDAGPPSSELSLRLRPLPRQARWFRKGVVSESLYTQLLTLAVGFREGVGHVRYLDVLRGVRAPGAMWWNPNVLAACTVGSSLVVLGVAVLQLGTLPVVAGRTVPSMLIRPLSLTMLGYIVLPFALTARARGLAYRQLLFARATGSQVNKGVDREMSMRDVARSTLRRMYRVGIPAELRRALRRMEALRQGDRGPDGGSSLFGLEGPLGGFDEE